MNSATGRSDRLIRETLDSVVTPSVRDSIMARALRGSELDEVPTEPEELRRFVDGPLREALIDGLGAELAEGVIEEVSRVARLSEPAPSSSAGRRASRPGSQRSLSPPPRRNTPAVRQHAVRRTPPTPRMPSPPPMAPPDPALPTLVPAPFPSSSRPPVGRGALTPPPHSGPISRPGFPWGSDEYPSTAATFGFEEDAEVAATRSCVLVASEDPKMFERLGPWLSKTAELVKVSGLLELLRYTEALAPQRMALLVDCRRPSIRPTAIAALAEDLPLSLSVVLWGPSIEQERGMLLVSPLVSRFIVVRADARPEEVAERCKALVG